MKELTSGALCKIKRQFIFNCNGYNKTIQKDEHLVFLNKTSSINPLVVQWHFLYKTHKFSILLDFDVDPRKTFVKVL